MRLNLAICFFSAMGSRTRVAGHRGSGQSRGQAGGDRTFAELAAGEAGSRRSRLAGHKIRGIFYGYNIRYVKPDRHAPLAATGAALAQD